MELSVAYMFVCYVMCNLSPMFILFVLLDFVGYKYFVVYPDRELLTRLERGLTAQSLVKSSSVQHVNGRDFVNGLFLGPSCVAFVDNRKTESIAYILTSTKVYADLMKEETTTFVSEPAPKVKETTQYVTVYKRRGTYKNFYYLPSRLDLGHIYPLGDQPAVVDGIVQEYKTRSRATIFLHGRPGTGKSTVGYLVAKQIHGRYCHTFNPSDPGDNIHELFNSCEVDSTTPLIVVIEEVDVMLDLIYNKNVRMSADIPTEVYSKATWTAFLDDLIFMKHVVLILTSNTPKQAIDDIDTALLRSGRIHASYCMNCALQVD